MSSKKKAAKRPATKAPARKRGGKAAPKKIVRGRAAFEPNYTKKPKMDADGFVVPPKKEQARRERALDTNVKRSLKKKLGAIVVELPEIEVTPAKVKGKKSAKPSGLDGQYALAFEQWKNGAQISALVTSMGFKRPALRRELIQRAGGSAGFKALRAEGAGGKAEPFGGKRAVGGAPRAVVVAASDKKVPIIDGMPRSKGWTTRRLWQPATVNVKDVGKIPWRELVGVVHISPDGVEYVECRTANESADLRVPSPTNHGAYLRFRKFEASPIAKKVAHHEKSVKHGEKLLEHRKTKKRAVRETRKAAKPLGRK